ncbi:monovalent cation/H+ antiporter subunit D family protein [Citricoccus sp. SGAir0253]|uniref:proton-conducting transporter transmembrane domain-containing protein n=1 Tax=Citricoccus sp. SGAir0253 TaxID=2567881 RepID=UPI0010CCF20B|nr:proton-conducting transporter membrane subunit [Citricoccus sp. SGAir0253]QCU77676.1 monovalent cation/H+ antiporter subunit D family protein [Citricoccus sp. SGAir0253]
MTALEPASWLPMFVAVPLLLAGVSVVLRRRSVDRVLMVAVPVLALAGAVALLAHHRRVPVLADAIGDYEGGIAIPFVSDTLTALMLATTALATAAACWFLTATGEDRLRFVPALALMLMAGVNGALLTGDLFNLFVFVEVMLLPSYALLAVTGTWRRLGVGRMFVIVSLVTSAILLMGVGLVYGAAGTVNLAVLAGRAGEDPQVALAVSVVLLALGIKAGVVPVHGWMPRAYAGTSAGVMALFSGLHTKVSLYALFRVYFTVFAPGATPAGGGSGPASGSAVTGPGTAATVAGVIAVVVLATMVVGALGSLGERRLRGVLAFQMVAGVGHILIGAAVASPAAVAAALFYLVHHVVTMASLLTTAGAVEHTYGTGVLGRISGLLHRDRLAAVLVALGLLSLAGFPPTSGLWGKLGLGLAVAGADGAVPGGGRLVPLFLAGIVVSSVITLVALQRLWGSSFAGPPLAVHRPVRADGTRGPEQPVGEAPRIRGALLAPGAAMMAVSVALFVFAGVLMPVVETAAAGLFDTRPYVEAVLP